MPEVPKLKLLKIVPSFDSNINKLYKFLEVTESILAYYFRGENINNFLKKQYLDEVSKYDQKVKIFNSNLW